MTSVRTASHAGSWYTDNPCVLTEQLRAWLQEAKAALAKEHRLQCPISRARIIIAPHAGYAYSGAAAAWAYACLDLKQTRRIFLLGPSHHKYLTGCALSRHTQYATPLGNLELDSETIACLRKTGQFDDMSSKTDSQEHSLEMHLPYIQYLLSQERTRHESSESTASIPPPRLIPILVGNTSPATERAFGRLLAPYLADPTTAFVISSDFCHWGLRFNYTYYLPSSRQDLADGFELEAQQVGNPRDPPIFESIERADRAAMQAISTGNNDAFLESLRMTRNTVCGRHPIGIALAALQSMRAGSESDEDGRFRFVRYERSSDVKDIDDSSVSYASAYAVV